MSRPPIEPAKTNAGIIVDPQSLDRVVPESRRADGSVRKEIRIRPGFTPQEDVKRFRGTRQAQMDASALPKGHIVGWVPPTNKEAESNKPLSKSAKKNAKRREKRDEKKAAAIKDSWEDDDEDDVAAKKSEPTKKSTEATTSEKQPSEQTDADALASDLKELKVQ